MKLSIIIPAYNSADFLEDNFCKLEKVYQMLDQDDFEIIYINDGSTDDSNKILEKIKSLKNNITVIHQKNQGSSGARNSGIDIAKGKYIQFLDSDDYIDWEKTIPLLHKALNKQLDAISYRIGFVDEKGYHTGGMVKHPLEYNKLMTGPEALIAGFQPSSICCWFYKTQFLNNHNLRIVPKITHMDVEFTTRMLTMASSVLFEDVIAYFYVSRSGSITKPQTQKKLEQFLYDEVIVADLIRRNITENTMPDLRLALQKNYNSVVWSLLWRFYKNKNEVSYEFKTKCIEELKQLNLYPIKGKLKTQFQKITSLIFNQSYILNKLI